MTDKEYLEKYQEKYGILKLKEEDKEDILKYFYKELNEEKFLKQLKYFFKEEKFDLSNLISDNI
jgi:hypothetical protein